MRATGHEGGMRRRWGNALRTAGWPALWAILGALACLPYLHALYWLGDEGILLDGAQRMAAGQTLYRDIFEFYPPLGLLVVRGWLATFGQGLLSARLLITAVIAGVAAFSGMACWRACGHRGLSTALVVAWLTMSQGAWTLVDHHWLTTLFCMVAAWTSLAGVEQARRGGAPVIAGLAAGAAAMTTPTRGALAVLAAVGTWIAGSIRPAWRTALVCTAAVAVAPLLCLAWIVRQGALAAAVSDVLVFPATQYGAIQHVPLGFDANLQNVLLTFVFTAACLLALLVIVRDRAALAQDARLRTAILFAVAGFLGCFPRPDAVHLAFAAPLVLPLLGACAVRLVTGWPRRQAALAGALAAAACLPSAIAYAQTAAMALSAPRIAAWDASFPLGLLGERETAAAVAALPPAAKLFFYPYMPLAPFLSGRPGVSRYDVFVPGYTSPAQYREACTEVMARADWVVVDLHWTNPIVLKSVFPALRDPDPPEKRAFEQALDAGFPLVVRHGAYELRRRSPTARAALCG